MTFPYRTECKYRRHLSIVGTDFLEYIIGQNNTLVLSKVGQGFAPISQVFASLSHPFMAKFSIFA